jgi:drug/metabolite transporter (DMT)-like permease
MIWGSAFVAQQIGMEKGLGPMTFNGLRFAIGFLSLIPVILWRKENLAPAEGEANLPCMVSVGAGLFLFAVCAVLSALCGLLFEHCSLSQIKAASGAIAYAGFMSVGIAYTLQVVCQKRCPPAPAAIIMSLEAVFAALAGYLVLKQTLTGRAIIGCFLILLGVLMVQLVPMIKKT